MNRFFLPFVSSKDSSKQSSEKSAHFSQADNPIVEKDSRRVNRVDLSGLHQFRNLPRAKMLEKEAELAARVAELAVELESVQPNMHAAERFDGIMEKLDTCNEELEAARKTANELANEFESNKKMRLTRFNEVTDVFLGMTFAPV